MEYSCFFIHEVNHELSVSFCVGLWPVNITFIRANPRQSVSQKINSDTDKRGWHGSKNKKQYSLSF